MNKPKFDPSKPFSAIDEGKPKFDPSKAFVAADAESGGSEETSQPLSKRIEAGVRGFGDSGLLGYGPNIRSAVEPIMTKGLNLITGNDVPTSDIFDKEAYIKRRDDDVARNEQLKSENPLEYYGGVGAGALALPSSKLKAATKLGGFLKAGATGAAQGLLQNPGEKEGEISGLQTDERLDNAKLGGLIGSGSQALVAGGGALAGKVGSGLKDFSEEKAVKAVGAMKGGFDRLVKQGKVSGLGRTLLDEGVVTPLASTKKMAERISSKIGEASDKVSSYIDKADDVIAKTGATGGKITTESIQNKLIKEIEDQFPGIPREELQPALDKVKLWFKDRAEVMTTRELQDLKVGLNNFLKKSDFYKDMPGMSKEGLLAVRRGAKEAIEQKGDAAAKILGDEKGLIKSQNKKLGNLLEASDLAEDAVARGSANRAISLTDYIAGGGAGVGTAALGSAIGAGPAAIAAIAANKFGRTYGNQLMATSADALSKQLLKIPEIANIVQKNPGALASFVQNYMKSTGAQDSMKGLLPAQ